MDTLFSSLDYHDPIWIAVAFGFGMAALQVGLPPLVGFLLAGFTLNWAGAEGGRFLDEIADLGVTLLLFSIGLKLQVGKLLKPQVWGVALAHMSIMVVLLASLLLTLTLLPLAYFADFGLQQALLVGFALSFSSTVFAIKVLEEKSGMSSRHGQLAIGILIMQDIAAVIFLAISAGKIPSPWALGLLLLIPARRLLLAVLQRSGHGELLILYGFVLALGGAALFEMVGIKGDFGALVLGLLLSGHSKTNELAKALLYFKELFLIGFFLDIGLTGLPGVEMLPVLLVLLAFLPVKTAVYFWLGSRFRLRARTSTLTALHLANYSEFGLIVGAIAITHGWLGSDWLVLIAVALSCSFILSAPLNSKADHLYARFRKQLRRFELPRRLPEDETVSLEGARVLILGMGRVGSGAYDYLKTTCGDSLLGIDSDAGVVARHQAEGRRVILGDASNPDFTSRIDRESGNIELVLVTLSNHRTNLDTIAQLQHEKFKGKIAATAIYPDQMQDLAAIGVESYYIFSEAGSGFARHAWERLREPAASQASGTVQELQTEN
jgi:glutathione-regulated potassium-efflux system ancillary protein KefC